MWHWFTELLSQQGCYSTIIQGQLKVVEEALRRVCSQALLLQNTAH